MNFNEVAPSTISFRGYGKRELMDVQNAQIVFRNFSGAETQYNRAGDANFAVVINDPVAAEQLSNAGWNVKIYVPKNGGEPMQYIRVNANFNEYGPHIYLCGANGPVLLDKGEVGMLDRADIAYIDLTISPYHWERNVRGEHTEGISAYLRDMYVTLNESPFGQKYSKTVADGEFPF